MDVTEEATSEVAVSVMVEVAAKVVVGQSLRVMDARNIGETARFCFLQYDVSSVAHEIVTTYQLLQRKEKSVCLADGIYIKQRRGLVRAYNTEKYIDIPEIPRSHTFTAEHEISE